MRILGPAVRLRLEIRNSDNYFWQTASGAVATEPWRPRRRRRAGPPGYFKFLNGSGLGELGNICEIAS
jgi:hypothetical protein